MSGARSPASTLTPDVSVIVSVWNDAKWLPAFMDSALSQDLENFELLITDDGSTDDTFEILNSYKDPRIRIFRNEERRYWINVMNDLAKVCRGRLIKPMCPDDLMKSNCLSTLVSFHATNPDVGYLFSSFEYMDHRGRDIGETRTFTVPARVSSADANEYFLKNGCYLNTSTICVPREIWAEEGGLRDLCSRNVRCLPLAEDFEMATRLSASCVAAYVSDSLVRIRVHGATVSEDLAIKGLQFEARLRVLQRVAKHLDDHATYGVGEGAKRFASSAAGILNLGLYYMATGRIRGGASIIASVLRILTLREAVRAWSTRMISKLTPEPTPAAASIRPTKVSSRDKRL